MLDKQTVTYSLDAPRKVDNTATAAMLIEDYLKGKEHETQ